MIGFKIWTELTGNGEIEAVCLWEKMQAKADKCHEYKQMLEKWIKTPSTLILRDLVDCVDDWNKLSVYNGFAKIDALSAQKNFKNLV